MRSLCRGIAAAAVFAALTTAPAAAQGRGNGFGRAQGAAISGGSAQAPAGRQFGSWLDDASVVAPGQAWAALLFGHFRLPGGHQTDFPTVDAGFGVTPRVQVGLSVPYYRLHWSDGSTAAGVGDVYASSKISLIDPSSRRLGVAVAPLVEIQNHPAEGSGRLSWAAPVNVEYRADGMRLFGSAGYFSRGALFGSGAIEVPLSDRLVVTGALSLTRSMRDGLGAAAADLPPTRGDVTATAAYFVTPVLAVFGGTGRSLGSHGTSLLVTGGLSISFMPALQP